MSKVNIELSDEIIVKVLEEYSKDPNIDDKTKEEVLTAVRQGKVARKGHWVAKKKSDITGELEYYCSECDKPALSPPFWECSQELSDFCPHCGIEMLHDMKKLK